MLHREPQLALPIEDQLLEAIISGALPAAPGSAHLKSEISNPTSLAAHFHLPLSRVLDILASPLTRSRLAAAQELRDLAFHQREQLAREKALAALETILDTSEDPIEKRRAATAILRRSTLRNPFWPRTPGAGATALDADDDDDEDAADPRPLLPVPSPPKWGRPVRETLIDLLTHLQNNDNPQPDCGLGALFLLKDRPFKPLGDQEEAIAYLKDPGEDAELLNFTAAILHNPEPTPFSVTARPSPDAQTERVTLHWPTHHRTVHFHFTASRGGENIALWKLAKLDIGPKELTPNTS